MTDRIRILADCYGTRAPHPETERLIRFRAGSELPLLEDFNREYFRTAHEGVLVYVPKASSYRVAARAHASPSAAVAMPEQPLARAVAQRGELPERIEVIAACGGFERPSADSRRLYGFGAGARLPVRGAANGFFETEYGGRACFVPVASCSPVGPGTATPKAPGTRLARVRTIVDCYGFAEPDEASERVCRLRPGLELPFLGAASPDFFRSEHEGRTIYLPAARCYRVDGGGSSATAIGAKATGQEGWPVKLLRVLAVIFALNLAYAGLVLIIFAPINALDPLNEVEDAYWLGLGGAVALGFGLGFMRLGARPLTQFLLLFSGIALAIGGIELLIFAIPVSDMRSLNVDTDRVLPALLGGGAALVVTGTAMGVVAFLRWWRNPASRVRLPDIARWAAIVYGGLLLLAGVSITGGVPATAEGYTPDVADAAAVGAAFALTLVPGAILTFHGLTMRRPRLNGPFRFLPAWPPLLLFGGAIAMGAIVVAAEQPVWLMTTAHAGAALLPALALIALASRGGMLGKPAIAGLTHRQVWLAFAVGVAVVTFVAATLDGLIAQALETAIFSTSGAFDGARSFDEVSDAFRYPDEYLSRGLSIFLFVSIVAVMAPVMEEGFKAFGVSLVLPRRPTPSQALTLGVAVGAGFGVLEASVYGLGGLVEGSEIEWWSLMLLRGGATTMHALNTGLLGLALYFGAAERRVRRGFLLYVAAVLIHGTWNALAILAGSRVIFEFETLSDSQLAILSFAVLGPLGVASFVALAEVARRAYRASPTLEKEPRAPTAVPFEPWVGV